MIPRRSFMALAAPADASSATLAAGAGGDDIFRVAIFRFAKENVDDAVAAFRTLASATRQEPGNIVYDTYRGMATTWSFILWSIGRRRRRSPLTNARRRSFITAGKSSYRAPRFTIR
jgi:hypothetical protein